MTAWEGPDGTWLQSLSVDFSPLASADTKNNIPDNVKACNEEIEALRLKSSKFKKKVRKANEEEKAERVKISALELEVAALEDRLAYQIHELEDGSSLATPSQSATAANPNEGGKANGLELPSDSDDDDDIVAFTP